MEKWCVVALVVLSAVAAGSTTRAQAPAPSPAPVAQRSPAAPPGNAANGRKLFVSVGCYQCHGYEAQGSTSTGPRLAPRPLAFGAFSKYVRHPTNDMPPFTEKVVSDTDLADIYAFLRSVPPPPSADSIPLLR